MRLKKRSIAAIIALIIVLLIVGSLLYANYAAYSKCRGAENMDKPGCFISEEENQSDTSLFSKIRFNLGSKYSDIPVD